MTCIEKLRELHPDWDDEKVRYYIEKHCPTSEYILPRPLSCSAHGWEDPNEIDCEKCWNREVDDDRVWFEICERLTGEDIRRLDMLAERTGYFRNKVIQAALKIYEDGLDAVAESFKRPSSMSFEVVDMNFDEQD